jgi:ribosomal protein S20
MATKTTFTPEEWDLLMTGVMSSGVAVTAADPSGLWGLMKESFASAKSLVEAKANPQSSDLIKAIVADFESSEARTRVRAAMKKRFEGAAAADVKARSIETLQEASALLDTKAPEEATSVKTWMRTIGQSVAEAAPEGGMFGFGGVQVSESEKATLAELSKALRLPA